MSLPSPIAARGPSRAALRLRRAWLAVALVAALAGRADAQGGPILPDPDPTAGLRVEGPLLSARPPGPEQAPPPNDPGPFRAVESVPGAAGPADTPADGPAPVQEPLLVVPPTPPPLPPMPMGGPYLPDSAFGTARSTQIQGPVGVMSEFSRWFHDTLLWGDVPYEYVPIPGSLLWKVPLANPREPRFYAKFFELDGGSYIDTAIGAQFGIGRVAPKGVVDEGLQLDVFGVVFTRFDPRRFLTAADYRAGIPLTYKKGPWSTKLSYEHTSTHIGDEYSQAFNVKQVPLVLDEVVLGLSRTLGDHVRLYGQYGYAFNTAKQTNADRRSRFDLGVEYRHYEDTGPVGRPFLAYDMDLREYQDYRVNSTFQAGWQWTKDGRSIRLAVEVYDGRSQFGQFYLDSENYVGFGAYFDW